MYRVGLESILGFTKRGETLAIDPCIPSAWKSFSIVYRYGSASYSITVNNPDGLQRGSVSIVLDGRSVTGALPLVDDGATHEVTATLSAPKPPPAPNPKSRDR